MALWDSLIRRGSKSKSEQDSVIEDLQLVKEQQEFTQSKIKEVPIDEDNSGSDLLYGTIESIQEAAVTPHSPEAITSLLNSDGIKAEQILGELKADYSSDELWQENEEMARDSVIGSAIEVMVDDACQVDEKTKLIVTVESDDEGLKKFLQEFLERNVNVEERIWTWGLEYVKHGDFKLRRREYYVGNPENSIKNVYYEDVTQPYKVTRYEYMGKILGYRDEEFDENKVTFEKPDTFVHFVSSKLSTREKVKLRVRNELTNNTDEITCFKVRGTSLVDNSRYIFRIVNLLDNMLILSRVARSTQYNIVKVEVGNASAAKTQQILSDVRRRIEGSTRLKKNSGMTTDPSPIPVNSNVYIPTRDGKGDITVDSVNENVDVHSITDIDYFRDKEFATLKVPKAYVGFDESATLGSFGNTSFTKLDARYARSVARIQTALRYGVENLCNNYLAYRGRLDDIGKFDIRMRPLSTAETAGRVEEHITNMQAFDSMSNFLETYGQYIDKAKLFKSTLNLIGMSPSDIASEEFLQILDEIEKGTYQQSNHQQAEEEDDEGGGSKW
jgi:hypothetical protein